MVSLPDHVLRELDVEAKRRGSTRSGLLRALAQDAARGRSRKRAEQMAALDASGGARGHGGQVAKLVKAHRPER
jgi:hypothetical protein